MKQLRRDYKNLPSPKVSYEHGFANGFIAAVITMTVIFKLTGLIP